MAGEADQAGELAPHGAQQLRTVLDATSGVDIREVLRDVQPVGCQVAPTERIANAEMDRVETAGEIWR
jgi:hypothetical protein